MDIPFFRRLESAEHVLIAGAGGGFDVFAGLPIYWALRQAGKQVSLANLSFSELRYTAGERLSRACVAITAESDGSRTYFPEKYLAAFLGTRGETAACVYAIERTGSRPVTEAYRTLHERLGFDVLVLIDGGTDSLMRGDEAGLGTPEEDAVSLLAADALELPHAYHVCVGLGVDHFHGSCNVHALEGIAELTRAGAFLGAFALPPETPEAGFYRDALAFVHERMRGSESIVNSSVLAAMSGQFGNHHATARTRGSELNITPVMGVYWAFTLRAVAERLEYKGFVRETESYSEVSLAIETYRAGLPTLRSHRVALD
jgi:hypothetical protein